jgi:hypothetical protein
MAVQMAEWMVGLTAASSEVQMVDLRADCWDAKKVGLMVRYSVASKVGWRVG